MHRKLIEALAVDDLEWQDYANCRGADADLFFPERGASTRKAKGICAECQVQVDCLEFAVTKSEKFGIWGRTVRARTPQDSQGAGHGVAAGRCRLIRRATDAVHLDLDALSHCNLERSRR